MIGKPNNLKFGSNKNKGPKEDSQMLVFYNFVTKHNLPVVWIRCGFFKIKKKYIYFNV